MENIFMLFPRSLRLCGEGFWRLRHAVPGSESLQHLRSKL